MKLKQYNITLDFDDVILLYKALDVLSDKRDVDALHHCDHDDIDNLLDRLPYDAAIGDKVTNLWKPYCPHCGAVSKDNHPNKWTCGSSYNLETAKLTLSDKCKEH